MIKAVMLLFQFHKVRLKERTKFNNMVAVFRFQFHKVRLKVAYMVKDITERYVSIP